MCGRYALYGPASRLTERFGVDFTQIDFVPRYNLAPMQFAPVIRNLGEARRVDLLRWGLLPSWSRDPAMATRLINARSETAAEKPSFRAAFKQRRCLVPIDGFYEWQPVQGGKQPYFLTLRSELPMALAGLWETWAATGGEELNTFTILTTSANPLLARLHERMPVILPPEAWALWLHPARTADQLMPLMKPLPAQEMRAHAVSRRVGNVRNDDPQLLDAVAVENSGVP